MRRAAFVLACCLFGASTVTACLYDYGDYDFEEEAEDTPSPESPTATMQSTSPLVQGDAGVSLE